MTPNHNEKIRPTKKQQELLTFIASFIAQNGYSPSYREIMKGLDYTSVATVALHVNSLIKRGHLIKREHSARSLEVVAKKEQPINVLSNEVTPIQEKWLVDKIEHAFREAENTSILTKQEINNLLVLVNALKVLGMEGASIGFIVRLKNMEKRVLLSP